MRAVALVLAGLAATAEIAAAPEQPELLPPWIVVESRLPPQAENVRASAWLAGDHWSGRAVVTLADAFRHIPGAVMLESFGGIEPPRLSIRGSGVQSAPTSRGLLLRLDDLPLGLADGSFNAALFDPLLGPSVEVQRGLDAWRTAPVTMGGTIDLRSITQTEPTGAALRIESGSFGGWRGRASARHNIDTTLARAAFSFSRQDGFREHSEQRRIGVTGTLRHSLRPETQLAAGFYRVAARYEVPGPLTLVAALASPRTISSEVERDRPNRDAALSRLHAGLTHRSAEFEFTIAASLARTTDDFRQLQVNGTTQSWSDDANLHIVAARRFRTGGLPHQVRIIAEGARGWRELRRFQNEPSGRGAEFAHDHARPQTSSLRVEDSFAPTDDVTVSVGAAGVHAGRDVVDRRQPDGSLHWRHGRVLPQTSVRWRVAPEVTVFGGVSSAEEAPVLEDLVSTASGAAGILVRRLNLLSAQHATTAEIGVRGRAQALAWDVTLYDARWRHEILRLADANGAPRGAVNASATRHRGIETAARWRLLERGARLTLAVSATWGDFRFASDPVHGDGRLAGLPPHIGYADAILESSTGGFAVFGADWTHGLTVADHAGRLGYGGRTLGHIRLGWKRPSWTCFIEVRNLFDRASIASTAGVLDLARNPAATSIFLPAASRSFNAGCEWKR